MAEFIHQPLKDDPNAVGPEPGDDVTSSSNPYFARLRRNRIAEGFAFALVTAGGYGAGDTVRLAVDYADRLIAELDKS